MIAAATAVALAVGCSSTADAKDELAKMGIKEEPRDVVALIIERVDARRSLGAAINVDYLQIRFAVAGYSWLDAACAVGKAEAVITPKMFAGLPIGTIENLRYEYPAAQAAAQTCATPESLARVEAGKAAAKAGTSKAGASAAPDIDGAVVGRVLEASFRSGADALGLSTEETDCVVEKLLGPLDPPELVKIVTGASPLSPQDTAPDVEECLGSERVAVIAPIAGKSLLDQKESAKIEHDRIQAKLDAEIEAMNAATTSTSTTP